MHRGESEKFYVCLFFTHNKETQISYSFVQSNLWHWTREFR